MLLVEGIWSWSWSEKSEMKK